MTQTKNLAERSGTVCVTKWWCRMGKKGWEVVSLRGLDGWLSPGHKQVRCDSSRPSLLKPHSSSPVSKTVPFLRKKIRSDLFFCHLITNFVSSPFCCRCFWFRYCSYSLDLAKFQCKIVLENSRVISQEFLENSFALIQCTRILKNIKNL